MTKTSKELLEEFIARGGKVVKHPPAEREPEPTVVSTSPSSGHSVIMTYSDADLYYGEVRKKKKSTKPSKTKSQPKIDFSLIPEELKQKLLSKESDDGE